MGKLFLQKTSLFDLNKESMLMSNLKNNAVKKIFDHTSKTILKITIAYTF
jgi:hypothetical protein